MSTLWTLIRPFVSTLWMLAAAQPPSSPPPPSGPKKEGPSTAAIITVVCAVLSWTMFPLIAAIVGIFVGRGELKKIERGESPQAGELLTKVGYYFCIANLVITVATGCISTAFIIAIYAGIIGGIGGLAIFSELANSLPQ